MPSRSLGAAGLLAVVMVALAVLPGSAQKAVPPPPPPSTGPEIAGGRGPNPFLGLAGWVDSPTSGPNASRFEVASVKRNEAGADSGRGGGRTLAGGVVRTTNVTLKMLIRMAYRLTLTDEIVGGPSWADSYGFDVDARPTKSVTLAESALMMRTLLADRFKLVVAKEPRDAPIYALLVARRDGTLGPQIKRSAGECTMAVPAFAQTAAGVTDTKAPATRGAGPPPGRPGRQCGITLGSGDTTRGGSVSMATLVTYLTPLVDRPVVDKTGLTGNFDFDLRFEGAATMPLIGRGRGAAVSPAAPTDPAKGSSIFTALQEQLGLRLDAQRGAVDVLAIKSAELPTEN